MKLVIIFVMIMFLTHARFKPMTDESNVELGYAIPGICDEFTPNGKQIVIYDNGLYDLAIGERLYPIQGYSPIFSPDGKWMLLGHGGIYNLATGEQILEISDWGTFSFDGKLVAVASDGVYETGSWRRLYDIDNIAKFTPDRLVVENSGVFDPYTGERFFEISSGFSSFSPDWKYLIIGYDAVYDIYTGEKMLPLSSFAFITPDGELLATQLGEVYSTSTWQRLFYVTGRIAWFSDDGTRLATSHAVYDTETGNILFDFPDNDRIALSPDGQFLSIPSQAVYDVDSGKKLFSIGGYPPAIFTPDSKLLLVSHDGVYETANGERLFEINGSISIPAYNSDHSLLSTHQFAGTGKINAVDRIDNCLIYGDADNEWPYRSGEIQVWPGTDVISDGKLIFTLDKSTRLPVLARSQDEQWLKVGIRHWVNAALVETLFMPEGIPIENP